MAITTPTGLQVVDAWRLLLPKMAVQPLKMAMENINGLWRWHRPQVASLAPHMSGVVARASEYHFAIEPSVDGLQYTFEHRFACSGISQAVTIGVDYCTTYAGGATAWTAIYSSAETSSGTGGEMTRKTHANYVIPATAVALRVTYTAPAAGTRKDHHVLAYPTPGDAVAGIQASGFVPFDDTLLNHADGGAVHTEWINRCKRSSVALLRDRKQMAFSWVQEYSTTPKEARTDKTAWWPMPAQRVRLPYQSGTVNLSASAIAAVTAGTTADLVRLAQLGGPGKSVLFAADGTVQHQTLQCLIDGTGADAGVTLQAAYRTTSGNTTRPFSVVAYYQPGT